jgi:hypothetical protein
MEKILFRKPDVEAKITNEYCIIRQNANRPGVQPEWFRLKLYNADMVSIAKEYLDFLGYDVTKREPLSIIKDTLWSDEHIKITRLDGFKDTFCIISITNPERYTFMTDKQLEACNKAVQGREPELKRCPNPECGGKAGWHEEYMEQSHMEYQIQCKSCGISGRYYTKPNAAIKAWNALPRKDEPVRDANKLKEDEC